MRMLGLLVTVYVLGIVSGIVLLDVAMTVTPEWREVVTGRF